MATSLVPFLYQTRTLRGWARTGAIVLDRRAFSRAASRASNPSAKQDDIPFELPPDFDIPKGDSTDSSQSTEPQQRSTITPTERETFNRIFDDIAARGKSRHRPQLAPSPGATKSESGDRKTKPGTADQKSGIAAINIIMQDAARAQGKTNASLPPFQPLERAISGAEQDDALLRFPPSLRRAARLALGVMEPGESAGDEMIERERTAHQLPLGLDDDVEMAGPLAKSVSVELMRRPERVRVEKQMLEAKTDMALWDVMEAEVFPMVYKLGINKEQQPAKGHGRKGKKRDAAVPSASAVESSGTLSMDIYGPLYPSYLLLSLRLLDQQFERSSPLALNILPRVKQLGLASYFLGASTPFYNSLMAIHWHRYGDINTVLSLLEEMHEAGLSIDEESLSVVQSAENFFAKHGDDPNDSFVKQLVQMPEYDSGRDSSLSHWARTISTQIQGRRRELQG